EDAAVLLLGFRCRPTLRSNRVADLYLLATYLLFHTQFAVERLIWPSRALFFRLLLPLGETDTGPTPILGDEFDAGVFKCPPDRIHNSANWLTLAGLKVNDGPQADAAPQGEIALTYI